MSSITEYVSTHRNKSVVVLTSCIDEMDRAIYYLRRSLHRKGVHYELSDRSKITVKSNLVFFIYTAVGIERRFRGWSIDCMFFQDTITHGNTSYILLKTLTHQGGDFFWKRFAF